MGRAARISSTTVSDIRRLAELHWPQGRIARTLGVSRPFVNLTLSGKRRVSTTAPGRTLSSCCQEPFRFSVAPFSGGRIIATCPQCGAQT